MFCLLHCNLLHLSTTSHVSSYGPCHHPRNVLVHLLHRDDRGLSNNPDETFLSVQNGILHVTRHPIPLYPNESRDKWYRIACSFLFLPRHLNRSCSLTLRFALNWGYTDTQAHNQYDGQVSLRDHLCRLLAPPPAERPLPRASSSHSPPSPPDVRAQSGLHGAALALSPNGVPQ
jgi:hypothetical protein